MITQTIGGGPVFLPIAPHIGTARLDIPSRWLLCSDGLTDMLSDAEIEEALGQRDEDTLRTLFAHAMAAGGADNISIILVSVMPRESAAAVNQSQRRPDTPGR
jgi:serine/threonine protein phosphatase PrpC